MKTRTLTTLLLLILSNLQTAWAKEAYAVFNNANATLKFYYDNDRNYRQGTTYALNTTDKPAWCKDGTNVKVTQVTFDSSFLQARPTSTRSWFEGMPLLTTIDGLQFLNTSEVTTMTSMFENCQNLTNLDLSNFCTRNVAWFGSMFKQCYNLKNLNLSSFKTRAAGNMQYMFYDCRSLTTLSLGNFHTTTQLYDISDMFCGCDKLTSLDLSGFNTRAVTQMGNMFRDCSELKTIYVGNKWSTAKAEAYAMMFYGCTSLEGGAGTTYSEQHTNGMYANIDGGSSNPGYLTYKDEEPEAYVCFTKDDNTLTFYFDNRRDTRQGKFYYLNRRYLDNSDSETPAWKDDRTCLTVAAVVFDSSFTNARPLTTSEWFADMKRLTSVEGMQYLNTSEVTDMSSMFSGCSSLTDLDVSHFNTSKVTNFFEMFFGCTDLKCLDLRRFETSSATTMAFMFCNCFTLTSLDLSQFTRTNVKSMIYMFSECSSLTTIYVSNLWISANCLQESTDMFAGCERLVGGAGTRFNANHTDAAYACIDQGVSQPGYLTLKPTIFHKDGIYYKDTGHGTVEVTYKDENYNTYRGEVVIPESVMTDEWTYIVAGIGEKAFYRCPSLKSVVIPATVDVIHNDAFYDSFIEFPTESYITCLATRPPTISPYAFSASELSSLKLNVLYGCKDSYMSAPVWKDFSNIVELPYNFKKGNIYYKITGDKTVSVSCKDNNYNCYSGSINIPSVVTYNNKTYTVTKIDNVAFLGCRDLTAVTIPETVTMIGNRTFKGCSSLTSIVIPNSVTSIGVNAFEDCTSLQEITLGSGLQSIGSMTFHNCTTLNSIICHAFEPPVLASNTFDNEQYGRIFVHVDPDYVLDYFYAPYWEYFYVDAIDAISATGETSLAEGIYDMFGRKTEKLQRGMNIIRYPDGRSKKVMVE